MNKQMKFTAIALIALTVPALSAIAGEKPFPDRVEALADSAPEGFAIGKGHTAYNGSVDGSIYKMNLRSGAGAVLNPQEIPDPYDCKLLGMRVDNRTNNLFVAGCWYEDLRVYDADSGELKADYQLGPVFESLVNDLTITDDAVYVTDSFQPILYRLPLGEDGELPANNDGLTTIALPAAFAMDWENDFCCGGNGIVSTPDGQTLIIGHSLLSQLYRVNPATGEVIEIEVSPPLSGFLDGLVLHENTLYIMNPDWEAVQVVKLDDDMLTGQFVGTMSNSEMSGIASGALFGKSLYVNNAHYDAVDFDDEGNLVFIYSDRWITKMNRHEVDPLE